ncbi:phage tail protein, partial [Sphingomonas oryzagri]
MKKVDALRALLLKAVPGLAAKPENLSLFVDKGRLGAIRTQTLSFEYRYTATIVVQDYAGDVDAIFVPLLAWVATNQPDQLRRADGEPFGYQIELLDGESCDVEIQLDLTERVIVKQGDAGWSVTHLDDAPMLDTFPGVTPAPALA